MLNFIGNGRLGFLFGELLVGDAITLNGHLHIVTVATPVGGLGVQDVTIWPRVRSNMAAGDPVIIAAPYGTWALKSARNGWGRGISGGREQSIELIEVI